jgi:hypothetical protein
MQKERWQESTPTMSSSGIWLRTHVLPSRDSLARTENLQPVLRLEVRRTRSADELGGCFTRVHHLDPPVRGLCRLAVRQLAPQGIIDGTSQLMRII